MSIVPEFKVVEKSKELPFYRICLSVLVHQTAIMQVCSLCFLQWFH